MARTQRLIAYLAFGIFLAVWAPTPILAAPATRATPFVAVIEALLQDPALYLSSATPHEPLLVANNALVALHAGTRDALAAICRGIDEAQQEILLQIYEYDDGDEAARTVFAALERKIDRSVSQGTPLAVGIVVGRAWPSEHTLQQRDIKALAQKLEAQGAAAAHVTLQLSSYRGTVLSILHTKSLVVDGQTAWVMTGNLITHGGIDVDSFNMAAHIEGPVVQTLRADWVSAQALSTVEISSGAQRDAVGTASITAQPPAQQTVSASGLQAAVLSRPSRWQPWNDPRPSLQSAGIAGLLSSAQSSIKIINPSIGAQAVQDALVHAIVQRRVQVTAVLSKFMNADREHHLFGGTNAEQAYKLYRRLLEEGGPRAAARLHVLWGSKDGITPGATHSAGNIHAKATAIDDDCLLIGSTNFNWLSFNTSREVTVALMGEGVALSFHSSVWPRVYDMAVPLRAEDIPVCKDSRHLDMVCLHVKECHG